MYHSVLPGLSEKRSTILGGISRRKHWRWSIERRTIMYARDQFVPNVIIQCGGGGKHAPCCCPSKYSARTTPWIVTHWKSIVLDESCHIGCRTVLLLLGEIHQWLDRKWKNLFALTRFKFGFVEAILLRYDLRTSSKSHPNHNSVIKDVQCHQWVQVPVSDRRTRCISSPRMSIHRSSRLYGRPWWLYSSTRRRLKQP